MTLNRSNWALEGSLGKEHVDEWVAGIKPGGRGQLGVIHSFIHIFIEHQ